MCGDRRVGGPGRGGGPGGRVGFGQDAHGPGRPGAVCRRACTLAADRACAWRGPACTRRPRGEAPQAARHACGVRSPEHAWPTCSPPCGCAHRSTDGYRTWHPRGVATARRGERAVRAAQPRWASTTRRASWRAIPASSRAAMRQRVNIAMALMGDPADRWWPTSPPPRWTSVTARPRWSRCLASVDGRAGGGAARHQPRPRPWCAQRCDRVCVMYAGRVRGVQVPAPRCSRTDRATPTPADLLASVPRVGMPTGRRAAGATYAGSVPEDGRDA